MFTFSRFLSTFFLLIFLSSVAVVETVQAAGETPLNFKTEFDEGRALLKKHQYKKAVVKFTVSIDRKSVV